MSSFIAGRAQLAAVSTVESTWQGKTKEEGKTQIDLILDRADRCMNLCEMKYWAGPFHVDKKIAEQLDRKKRIFKAVTQTKKTLFTTLITLYAVEKTSAYQSIDQYITLDDLFS